LDKQVSQGILLREVDDRAGPRRGRGIVGPERSNGDHETSCEPTLPVGAADWRRRFRVRHRTRLVEGKPARVLQSKWRRASTLSGPAQTMRGYRNGCRPLTPITLTGPIVEL